MITARDIERFLEVQPADEIGDRYCQITPDGELLPYTEPPTYPVLALCHTGFRGVDDLVAALDPDVDAAVTEWHRQAKPTYVDRDPFGTRAAIAARQARDSARDSARCVWSVRPMGRAWNATLTLDVLDEQSTIRSAREGRIGETEAAATYALQSSGMWRTLLALGITPERVP